MHALNGLVPPPHCHAAAPRCTIKIRLTKPETLDYLNLAEIELYDTSGARIPAPYLSISMGSVYGDAEGSYCHDGNYDT
jgi:hypothetical protein